MLLKVKKNGAFIGSLDLFEEAGVVILGAPMDVTSSFRAGSRFGPAAIRAVSDVLEMYSPVLGRDLEEVKFYDAGDIILPLGNVRVCLDNIYDSVHDVINNGKKPVILGGEHLITLPAVQVLSNYYSDLCVLQLDAHADLRDAYDGEQYSHATVIRRIVGLGGGDRVFQCGIRSGTKDEFEYAKENTNMLRGDMAKAIDSYLPIIGQCPVYITLDIDVLDPAYAPGTGTPEPGGINSQELFSAIYRFQGLNIVGFDIVEVNPGFDPSERTQILAAKILREILLMMS